MRDWLAGWLRRLANRISAPQTGAALAAAGVGFNRSQTPQQVVPNTNFYAVDVDEMLRHWRKRGGGDTMKYYGRP